MIFCWSFSNYSFKNTSKVTRIKTCCNCNFSYITMFFFYKVASFMYTKSSKILMGRIKGFTGEFRLLARYLDMLIMVKSARDCDSEEILKEVEKLYSRLLNGCTDDKIRIWIKQRVCMFAVVTVTILLALRVSIDNKILHIFH